MGTMRRPPSVDPPPPVTGPPLPEPPLTDPPLNALRKVIPPIRLVAASIDLGFLVLVLVLYLLLWIL